MPFSSCDWLILDTLPLALSNSRKVPRYSEVSSSVRPNLPNSCIVSVPSLSISPAICGTPWSTVPNNFASVPEFLAMRSVNLANGIMESACALRNITMEDPNDAPDFANCVNASTLESISRPNSFINLPTYGTSPKPASTMSSRLWMDLVVSDSASAVLAIATPVLSTILPRNFNPFTTKPIGPGTDFAVFWNLFRLSMLSSISLVNSSVSSPLFFSCSFWSSIILMIILRAFISCAVLLVFCMAVLRDPRSTVVRSLSSLVMSLSSCSSSLSIRF